MAPLLPSFAEIAQFTVTVLPLSTLSMRLSRDRVSILMAPSWACPGETDSITAVSSMRRTKARSHRAFRPTSALEPLFGRALSMQDHNGCRADGRNSLDSMRCIKIRGRRHSCPGFSRQLPGNCSALAPICIL